MAYMQQVQWPCWYGQHDAPGSSASSDGWSPGAAWDLPTARNPHAASAPQPMAAPAKAPKPAIAKAETTIKKAGPASAEAEKATP